jgi:hypothetical protein
MCDLLTYYENCVLDTTNLTDKRVEPVRVNTLHFVESALSKAIGYSKLCFELDRSHFKFPKQGHEFKFPQSLHFITISLEPKNHRNLEKCRYKHSDRLGENQMRANVTLSEDEGKYYFKVMLHYQSDVEFTPYGPLLLEAIEKLLPRYADVTFEGPRPVGESTSIILIKCNLLGLLMDIHRSIQVPSQGDGTSVGCSNSSPNDDRVSVALNQLSSFAQVAGLQR